MRTTVASTRPRRPSTVHSTWSFEPGASYVDGTDASAIACLRIGLQPRLVTLPIWGPPRPREDRLGRTIDRRRDRRRQVLVRYSPSIPYQSSVRPTSRRFGPVAAASRRQRQLPDEVGLLEIHEPAQPELVRGVVLLRVERVAGRGVVHLEQDQPGLEPDDVERQHPGRPDPVRRAGVHQRVPDLDRALRGDPDLVAEVAGVAGPRDVDGDTRELRCGVAGSSRGPANVSPVAASSTARANGPWSATAAIASVSSSTWTSRPRAFSVEPAVLRIRGGPAVLGLGQAMDGAVVDDLAVLVAPRRVVDLPDA